MIRFLCLVLLTAAFTLSQVSTVSANPWNFKLTQHSTDKNQATKPALLQYTNPEGSDSSVQIDAAIKAVYTPAGSTAEYAAVIEKHENDLVTKKQDLLSGGFSVGDYLYSANCTQDGACLKNVLGSFSVTYQDDDVKNSEGILAVAEISGLHSDLYLNSLSKSKEFPFFWSPTVGLEYESIQDAANDAEGEVGRIYGNLEVFFFPGFTSTEGRVSMFASYSVWEDFSKDDRLDIEDDTHTLKKVGLEFLLTPETDRVKVTLNLSWQDGENPRLKLPDQKFTQFGLGISF